jgi:hypothetical protein
MEPTQPMAKPIAKKKYRVLVLLFLAGMLSLHLIIAWDSIDLIRKGYPDFSTFYSGASIVRQGLGKRLYDEATQYRVQLQFAAGVSIRQGPLPYIHPPFEALLFIPLTWLSYPTAYLLWNLLNLVFLVLLFFLLRDTVPWLRQVSAACWLLGCLAFFPVFFALLQGQDILMLVVMFGAAYVLLRRNSDLAAGCCLGLGVFRFHLVLPLVLILLYQKRSKVLAGFLATATVLGLISVAIIGWEGALSYPRHVWYLEQSMERRQTIVPIRMASIRGLFDSLLIPHFSKLASDIAIAAASLALVLVAARKWKLGNVTQFDLGFALCVIVTVLTSYHTLTYDLSLLLLPLALTIQHVFTNETGDIPRRTKLAFLILLFLLFFSPLHAFLVMRDGHYNLFALVLLWWCWMLFREMESVRKFATA